MTEFQTVLPAPEAPVRDDDHLASELRLAVMRLRRRLAQERHPDNDVPISHMGVLAVLNRCGDMTLGELAAVERVQPPSMTRTVKCLEERALVSRRPHETDGRITYVSITDGGRATVAADRDRRDAWLARRLDELAPDEREALRRAAPLLERLAQED